MFRFPTTRVDLHLPHFADAIFWEHVRPNSWTPLIYASRNGHLDVVDVLRAHGAKEKNDDDGDEKKKE